MTLTHMHLLHMLPTHRARGACKTRTAEQVNLGLAGEQVLRYQLFCRWEVTRCIYSGATASQMIEFGAHVE
jgi:hypothetical protein